MKRISFLLGLFIIPMISFAQGFSISENRLSWQFVYTEQTVTIDDIFLDMLYSNDYDNINIINDNILLAELKPQKLDVEDYGFKRMTTPLYLQHYMVGPVMVRVETKENRYRVTAMNIRLTNVTSNFAHVGAIEEIEVYIFTNEGISPQLNKYIAPMLGDYFLNSFLFKKQEEEEW